MSSQERRQAIDREGVFTLSCPVVDTVPIRDTLARKVDMLTPYRRSSEKRGAGWNVEDKVYMGRERSVVRPMPILGANYAPKMGHPA